VDTLMQPTADFDAPTLAKSLLRRRRQGALATLMSGTGAPYCSLVNLASHPDGSPILLISKLAIHTRNILADQRVSLMLDERAPGDPLEGARIMIMGRSVAAESDAIEMLRRRYLAAHPSAEMFVGFTDFGFYRLEIETVHLVAGFGRIIDLTPAQVLTDLTGAESLLAAEEEAVAHMNDDHADALGLYATRLLGAPDAAWRCTGLDPEGIDLAAQDAAGSDVTLRLPFPTRLTTPGNLRKALAELAAQARSFTGR
jgi:putative heme iron utilization protein